MSETMFTLEGGEVVLTLGDLFSKFGFEDGNLLDDTLAAAGLDPFARERSAHANYEIGMRLSHRVLVFLVKTFLLSDLNYSVETIEFVTTHNPIRAKESQSAFSMAQLKFSCHIAKPLVVQVAETMLTEQGMR